MQARFKKSVFSILFFIGFILIHEAWAISVSIDKPHINVDVEAGDVASGAITLKNRGKAPLSVRLNIEDWIYNEDGRRVFKLPGSTPLSCANWIEISPRIMIVPDGGIAVFNYTVRVPEDAVGGHYAVIFFESSAAEEEEVRGTGIKVVGRIGSIVYQETKGKVNKVGTVLSKKVTAPEANKPLVFKYRFKNEGNAFIRFNGTLNIMDENSTIYGTAQSERSIGTLPGNVRDDTIKWFGSLPKGKYDVILTVDMGEDVQPMVIQESIFVSEDIQ